MAGKKPAPAANEEYDEEIEAEGWEEEPATDLDAKTGAKPGGRLRDWRDVEKFREMRELRRLVDDDFGIDEVLGNPARTGATPVKAVRRRAAVKAGKARKKRGG